VRLFSSASGRAGGRRTRRTAATYSAAHATVVQYRTVVRLCASSGGAQETEQFEVRRLRRRGSVRAPALGAVQNALPPDVSPRECESCLHSPLVLRLGARPTRQVGRYEAQGRVAGRFRHCSVLWSQLLHRVAVRCGSLRVATGTARQQQVLANLGTRDVLRRVPMRIRASSSDSRSPAQPTFGAPRIEGDGAGHAAAGCRRVRRRDPTRGRAVRYFTDACLAASVLDAAPAASDE
jgi:hypothetical protein